MNHHYWNLLPLVPEHHVVKTAGYSALITQLLYNRGFTTPSLIDSFMSANEPLLGDPLLLPDIQRATSRIYRALLSGENIAVYGDFDVDGITSTALMVKGLSSLGGNVIPYIPNRLTEGYGLKTAALENLCRQGISLVITVDCGTTAIPQIEKAQKTGLDIIVTDHHTTLEELPPAIAVINPKWHDSAYPFRELAGVGVAFKLMQAVLQGVGKAEEINSFTDLVALGTIADLVPLVGENRYLVKQGLDMINTHPRLGIREIMVRNNLDKGKVDSGSISWVIAPRLNAAGRISHAMTSYQLLTTESPEEASDLTITLEEKNKSRQRMTTRVLSKAREQILSRGITPLLIASDRDYPQGIIGLAAGRICEEFYRPTIIIKAGEKTSSGSCRSIPEFNITQALEKCQHLLTYFGGHAQAAGFTLPTENLTQLEEELNSLATSELKEIDLKPQVNIDAEVKLSDLNQDMFKAINHLAPFGRGNPLPNFISRGVDVINYRTIGSAGSHLVMKFRQENSVWDGVGFRMGDNATEITSHMDILYNIEVDNWNGADRLRLNLLDFHPLV
ncbi:single-stranded-DNA-specific exonuclease RecJ [Chloroflexota bacterium]